MDNIKCPLCGGKVKLISPSVIYNQNEYIRNFKLVCHKCGLTSREVDVVVSINCEGEIVSTKDMFNGLLRECGSEHEKK